MKSNLAKFHKYFNEALFDTLFVLKTVVLLLTIIYIVLITRIVVKYKKILRGYWRVYEENIKSVESFNGVILAKVYQNRNLMIRYLFILSILALEGLQRILSDGDMIFLEDQHGDYSKLNLTSSCTIKEGITLTTYYKRGHAYAIIIGVTYSVNLLILYLTILLTDFINKTYLGKHQQKQFYYKLIVKVLFGIALISLVAFLYPFQWAVIPTHIVYAVIYTVEYIILIIKMRQLYRVLQKRNIYAQHHQYDKQVKLDAYIRKREFKIPAIFFMIFLGMSIFGQSLDIAVKSVIGTILLNPCWIKLIYGVHISLDVGSFSQTVYYFSNIAVYAQFISDLLLNFVFIVIYLIYSVKYYRKLRNDGKKIGFRYRYGSDSCSDNREPLLNN